jgi:hypothetical protein
VLTPPSPRRCGLDVRNTKASPAPAVAVRPDRPPRGAAHPLEPAAGQPPPVASMQLPRIGRHPRNGRWRCYPGCHAGECLQPSEGFCTA